MTSCIATLKTLITKTWCMLATKTITIEELKRTAMGEFEEEEFEKIAKASAFNNDSLCLVASTTTISVTV